MLIRAETNNQMSEEKLEKAIEWLENASYNLDNVSRVGTVIVPMIKNQIENSIKLLKDEELPEGVWGA